MSKKLHISTAPSCDTKTQIMLHLWIKLVAGVMHWMQRTIERYVSVFMSRDRLMVFTKQLQACALYLAEPGRQPSDS
ncbi:unnamed protein product [Albugo candida]|uniref:Uncharacterized protein n=1 Tax=Albugo candida TaxID=65357 RepID=A0A024G5Y1_9STRA|nr:unnamed protein product [Albugo candida]|eukprot:CCI42072.1 unnamed protein product [Albugo candida]